jgi:hypothetical protein
MKRGPQPKKVFDAAQCHVRADRIRALSAVLANPTRRAGMERLAAKLEQRAALLETREDIPVTFT